MHEARIDQTPDGRVPADGGWWILNLADIAWERVEGGGVWSVFESPAAPGQRLGIGVHVLQPGEPSGKYHREDDEESFLVLAGECLLIVEGEERRMRQWDVFCCPAGTAHITVGAGDGPCAILMAGSRTAQGPTTYPPDPVARRHGADVPEETTDPAVAYADRPPIERAASPWPAIVGPATPDAGEEPSVAALRRQVTVLSAALGMREPLWDVPPVVREHVRDGEIVKAVRELRRGVPGKIGLLEAKRMVDALGDARD
jgi:uncharacterized cupin superfamily protein